MRRTGPRRPVDAASVSSARPTRQTIACATLECVKHYPVGSALVLVAVQYATALVLFWLMIDIAYRFEGIDGWDRVHMLGAGPQLAAAAAVVPALLCPPLTIVLLFTRFRARAWVISAVGWMLGIAVWLYAISTFEQPPLVGG